nr:hypothetical protein CFP56_63902 [Quercus suber]
MVAATPEDASAATPEDTPAATPMQHSMPPNAAANASGANASGAIISAAQISRSPARFSELKNTKTYFDEEVHEYPDASDFLDANDVFDASALPAVLRRSAKPSKPPSYLKAYHSNQSNQ